MNVSVHDEATSSHGDGSSRFSNSFDKTVDSVSMEPISGFFHNWIDTLSSDCVTSFLDEVENHHNHDVDTTNGQLLEKIEQPDTIVNIEEEALMKPAMLHRRRDWTSNLVIHREIAIRKGLMRRQQEEKKRERCSLPAQDTQGWEPKENRHYINIRRESISNDKKLLVDCVLRPVRLEDAIGCAEAYNAAVADHDHQAVDTSPVSAERFEFIIRECMYEKLPFVVATKQKVDLSDAKNWPSLDAYRQYMRWRQSQPEEDKPTEHNICGFAFLRPYERGICGLSGTACLAVKATVFVRPDRRRGGIGSALIRQILTQTSILYYGNGAKYKWEDPNHGDDSFRTSGFRNVHRIIFHTMDKRESNQSLKWMDNFMASLQFEKSGRISQVYRVDTPHGVEWYDQIIWQHWANKIDSVRTLYMSDESECSYDYPGKPHAPDYQQVQLPPVVGEELGYGSDRDSDDVFGH
ncbi:uncharacterized protein GLRG_02176 [Colletotrichum graminicola M1.001]|uniref:Uncharacterized protein n=1 Tax=Colletotrichum graminicola (strain M1.001 / M2 / FGSC 10212) TaxID=645133 RepID=E3Q7Z3_COLGM|nr:uncharacterized protein GLRG_02176 [Colletotrichum graminicola M1.001]EFQ27005.1 hypothetical protein GLRG_02176 [Colletotrichum graminicola M1.001]